jgi:RNA polymerase sigma-70 factor (ECF subfamily)
MGFGAKTAPTWDGLMSQELPAEELLARVAQRDVAALGELYDRYAPRVYGLVAHILSSRTTAEEIIQEVFVRLWSESTRLSQEGRSVAAWLVVTAREAALDRLRALHKTVARTRPMVPVPSAWLPPPKEIALIDDRLVLLHKVIDQLPKPQQQALELAVFGGLTEAEIAAAIGEPLGKVQRSLRAAVTFVKHRRRAVCGTWAANI